MLVAFSSIRSILVQFTAATISWADHSSPRVLCAPGETVALAWSRSRLRAEYPAFRAGLRACGPDHRDITVLSEALVLGRGAGMVLRCLKYPRRPWASVERKSALLSKAAKIAGDCAASASHIEFNRGNL